MIKKIGRFFEENVEKITLIVVGMLCVLLFIWRVLFSPNMVEIKDEDGKTISLKPSVVDVRISTIAMQLSNKHNGLVTDTNSYESRKGEYLAALDSSLSDIDSNLIIPNPEIITPVKVAVGQYNVPENIGSITDIAVEHIRAAAYLPTEPVTEIKTYDQVKHEPNDIDFVTVQGTFDIAECYRKFHESFYDQVEEEFADPCLARPIFASVQLQRRELGGDGMWGDWQNVERSKIDQYKDLFENLRYGESLPPGGLKLQKLQFDNKMVQVGLLQPRAYEMASAREEWLPPLLHRDYTEAMKKIIKQDREKAREEERKEREREANERHGGGTRGGGQNDRTRNTGRGGTGGRAGGGRSSNRDTYGNTGTGRGSRRTGRGRGREETVDMVMETGRLQPGGMLDTQDSGINKVYQEFSKISLNYTTDLSEMDEPLVFWAHDDTVEPGRIYQYKIRLGVFNPVAEGKDDNVIVWSHYSRETEPVEIPGRLYFFVKSMQDTTNTVTVNVCKYFLGYWRSEDFREVGLGDAIGGIKKYEPEEPEEEEVFVGINRGITAQAAAKSDEITSEPESINFDTGAVIIDLVAVSDWVVADDRNMNIKPYYDMLYSYGGADIEHMPVSLSNLPVRINREIRRVSNLSREDPEPFKAFGSSGVQQGMGLNQFRGMGDYGVPMRMMIE